MKEAILPFFASCSAAGLGTKNFDADSVVEEMAVGGVSTEPDLNLEKVEIHVVVVVALTNWF